MRAGGEVEAGEIGLKALDGVHGRQGGRGQGKLVIRLLASAVTKKVVRVMGLLHLPERIASVRGEAVKSADFCEGSKFDFIEMRAGFEIVK
jgi:hypothetical protein